ncbi:FkbM family methyltransferase [Sphingomonas sp. ID0503]|uniref:FkbM family methyltransferase n=1 Tax=Sphingomonas sp. ID0503 TaxID=3399691 RepID=UPI003AFA7516
MPERPPLATRFAELEKKYRLVDHERAALHWGRLKHLVPAPDIVVDAGASLGTPRLYKAFPTAKFILVDPIEENRAGLEAFGASYDIDIRIVALGAARGEAVLNVGGNAGKSRSSFLERSDHLAGGDEKRLVPVAPLTDLVPPTGSIGLKIDTEGYELEVLKGAEPLFPRIPWIVAETSMFPRFHGDPLFAGIYGFLAPHGYQFRDFVSIRRNPDGGLRHVDALFVRTL